jgi:enoyl-CoA hydratase
MLNATRRDNVLLLELKHGKVNALDLELLRALIDTFRTAPDGQPVVLTGAGRAFSAGVDLRRILEEGPDYTTRLFDALSECFLAVYDHPGPVIAAINGSAIAGGCVIAAACDRRLISRGPIGLAELAVGVPFPISALEIMRSLLGPAVSGVVLGARTFEAEEARTVGLVDEIVAPDRLLSRALENATDWGALPEGVFAHTKRQLHRPTRERITVAAATDDPIARALWASPAVRHAIERYMTNLAHARRP